MILWTGHYSIRHPARVDITRAGCDRLLRAKLPAPGAFLAPSGDLLRWGLNARKVAATDEVRAAAWAAYEAEYLAEVADRIARDRRPLDALLAMPEVVAVCYCGDEYTVLCQCHRFPAARVLVSHGAEYRGEMRVEPTPPRQMGLFGGAL